MEGFKCLILLIFYIVKVESLAIKGTPLTRYNPCGLGVVHFDKVTDRYWLGVLNLGLYRNLAEPEIELQFEKKTRIFLNLGNSSATSMEEGLAFLIRPSRPIPKRYTFYLALEGLGENDTHLPTITKFAMNNITLCSDAIKTAQTLESLDVAVNDNKYQEHICGRKFFNHTELTSVGSEAKAGDWPWHVFILFHNTTSDGLYNRCGGTIISMTAVLTACHCVGNEGVRLSADMLSVVAGISKQVGRKQIGKQISRVNEVVLNLNYKDGIPSADLAVLKVDNFRYTAYVQPICIWGPIYSKQYLIGRQATVVGFGSDVNENYDGVLKAIFTTVQNDTTCWNYGDYYVKAINEFTICAGNGPTSEINVMKGDSGGGLVIPVMQPDQKVSWFLRGVVSQCVSSYPGKCDPHYYAIYTDVGPHYSWILHHSGLQFEPNPYQQDYVS
ncbi:hypothetical protein ABMA28_001075 [Loxostege sticticalis]|uniref:Peptidase S1 domain-containing protein n=1 Tax=Loxostege sticticalis TaxID=481309 RepID=A0ABD0T4J7_LOXSC